MEKKKKKIKKKKKKKKKKKWKWKFKKESHCFWQILVWLLDLFEDFWLWIKISD